MSIKLTNTQLVILSAAAQREDRCLILPPTLKGGAAQKVANKLISSGFTKEVRAKAGAPIWRRDEESGEDYALKLTAAGAKAIAVAENPEREHGNDDGGLFENADEPTAFPEAPLAEAIEPDPVGPSAPRTGSKLARVIELLRRDRGATIDELIAATGWLAHTTRAALTGLRKRGYPVAIDRSDNARGSFYRIQTDRTEDAKALAAADDDGRASSEAARKNSLRRAKPYARRAA